MYTFLMPLNVRTPFYQIILTVGLSHVLIYANPSCKSMSFATLATASFVTQAEHLLDKPDG